MRDPYPLQWPPGVNRTLHRGFPKFSSQFAQDRDSVIEQLKRRGASQIVITSDLPVRLDGLPYASSMRVAKLTVTVQAPGAQDIDVRLAVEESGGVFTLRQVEAGPCRNRDGDLITATERFEIARFYNGDTINVALEIEGP